MIEKRFSALPQSVMGWRSREEEEELNDGIGLSEGSIFEQDGARARTVCVTCVQHRPV